MKRRDFAAALTAGVAAPALLSATPASAADRSATGLLPHMRAVLASELDDRNTAEVLIPHVYDVGLDWHPETAPPHGVRLRRGVCLRQPPPVGGGDPTKVRYEPGPVNEQLADTVAKVRARRDVPVYAQWEIARFLDSKYGMSDVTSMEPVIAPDGSITYLSTDGVAAQVLEARMKAPGGIGTACVIGFRDHHKRCVQTTRDRGMKAYAPHGFAMPHTYDSESGQAWTRRRDLYLVHDMLAQWTVLHAKQIAEAYPNG